MSVQKWDEALSEAEQSVTQTMIDSAWSMGRKSSVCSSEI
jgi:hypothetical protein